MNKLFGHGTKGAVLACILEPGNIEKLKQNQPIEIDLNDGPWKTGIPPKVQIVIAYSETPIADMKNLPKHFNIDPENIEDRRTPKTDKLRPHCPECKSTVEQLALWRSKEAPLWLTFCGVCGCTFGVTKPILGMEK